MEIDSSISSGGAALAAAASRARGLTKADEGEPPPAADAPNRLRGMVACRRCYLVKTFEQFYQDGCENCPFLRMNDGNLERCKECTTPKYQGLAAMMRNKQSWVAKWQGLAKFCTGVYAMRVNAELPEHIKDELIQKNIPFFPPNQD